MAHQNECKPAVVILRVFAFHRKVNDPALIAVALHSSITCKRPLRTLPRGLVSPESDEHHTIRSIAPLAEAVEMRHGDLEDMLRGKVAQALQRITRIAVARLAGEARGDIDMFG